MYMKDKLTVYER